MSLTRGIGIGLALSLSAVSGLWAAEATIDAPGADGDLLRLLQSGSLSVAAVAQDDAAPHELLSAARADYATMLGLLYSAGYYSGTVTIRVDGQEAANIPPLSPPTRVDRIAITVTPGPRFAFSRASIAPLPPDATVPDGFRTGEPAETEVIRTAVSGAISDWRDAGHAKADVSSQSFTADHRAATLAADVRLTPGPQLTFGNLFIEGRSSVNDRRLRKIMGLPTGSVFSPQELTRAATRLRRTGVFRSVAIQEADQIGPNNTLDITATVVDEKPRRIGFGGELSTLEGLSVEGFWLRRNLFGGAERLRIDGAVSGVGGQTGGIDYSASVRIDRPATLSADTNGFVFAGISQDDEDTYLERAGTLAIGFEHYFSDTLTGEIGLSLNYSDVEEDGDRTNFFYVGLPTGVTWDRRNDALEPTRGIYLAAEAMPFLGLSDTASGLHAKVDARGYIGFGQDDRVVLAGRLQLGSVVGAGIDEVPPGLLFFSGGGGTVRGQPYKSLVIDQGGGDTSGGRSFLGLSAEIRTRIAGSFGAVGFFDAGYISDDSLPGSGAEFHSGAGVGLRYFTTIGAIRLDIATPVGGDTGDGIQYYIGIGQSF